MPNTARRTALACNFCRQRKARCSGEWPQCRTCKLRDRDCEYPGSIPPASVLSTPGHANAETEFQLPPLSLRRLAISFFRENYAKSLLCFLPPQQLVEDAAGEGLPLPLLVCIIALTSRKEVDSLCNQPSITHIQCCLILCVVEVGEGLEHQAWLRLGHAARLAQLARLHKQDPEHTNFDWGDALREYSLTELEIRRRTFWCLFCLDHLLANGRDRIATFASADITTHLPQLDEDFIFGRYRKTGRLSDMHDGVDECLFSHTIRIIDLLGNIVLWHGRSGRRQDARCPWLPDMPFTIHSEALAAWRKRLPSYWDYQPQNVSLVVAAGQGQLWSLMFLLYFHAKTYLYREYLPFTPSPSYDPNTGPADGPTLLPVDCAPPPGWWFNYATTMLESANSVATLYSQMHDLDLAPSAFPFTGLCLFTSASIHAMFTIFEWDSLQHVTSKRAARRNLSIAMRGFNSLGQYWDLSIHWIRQISLFYKLNYLTHLSFLTSPGTTTISTMNIADIKDGIMNYLRQLNPTDRTSRRTNLKPTFDFEGWLKTVESGTIRSDSQHRNGLSPESSRQSSYRDVNQGPSPVDSSNEPSHNIYYHGAAIAPDDDLLGAFSLVPSDEWDDLSLKATFWDQPTQNFRRC
ncbi:hypothetical protein UA08_04900 [Talaromyces atroroseus]|uniref:Zn(2)-C6 fungal-type domain-containing protein n=1 Tax=Talaromyces atroroseus TaxID=1441469 RepID=A0A225AFP1_TALAT|nr:hypothetical protein UA08_04900 [Talaromyces atroroseus]OKL60162.1 hypothetical protein UA08_04900 [Talaromyces atroroseus]